MESAEIKDTHLHVQNFINKAHFSQKLIFFANKIFGYFDFCIFFFFIYNINCYVSTSEFYIPHCFVYIPCMSVVIPCSIRIKIIYIYIHLFHFLLLSQFQLRKKNGSNSILIYCQSQVTISITFCWFS